MSHPAPRTNQPSRRRPRASATTVLAARFAQQLAALRAQRGETQKQLALRLGMTESMISRFETGAHLPSLTTLARIASAFDRRLEIVFHEHEHVHTDGVRHSHVHGHDDGDHLHAHEDDLP